MNCLCFNVNTFGIPMCSQLAVTYNLWEGPEDDWITVETCSPIVISKNKSCADVKTDLFVFKTFPNSSKHQRTSLLQSICESVLSSVWFFSRLLRATCTCCTHLQGRDVEMFVVRIQKQSQLYNLYFFLNKAPKLSGWRCSTLCWGCRKPSSTTTSPKKGTKTCILIWLKLIMFRSARSSASQCTFRYVVSTGKLNCTSRSSLTVLFPTDFLLATSNTVTALCS